MSKISIPIHSSMLISRNLAFQTSMPKSNKRFSKQVEFLDFDSLNWSVSPMKISGNSVSGSHKKKSQTLVSKGVLDSYPLRKLNNQDENEFLKGFEMIWLFALFWNYFPEHRAEIPYLMVVMAVQNLTWSQKLQATSDPIFLPVPRETIFGKYKKSFGKLRDIEQIFDAFLQQMPIETKGVLKSIEHFHKSTEKTVITDLFHQQRSSETIVLKDSEKLPEVSVSNAAFCKLGSDITDTYQSREEMKRLKMCYLCQEKIAEKKFFDERRFGIFSDCDCMICYGCIRKAVRKAGMVKASICPSCSVKSDIFATSCKWIESEEKDCFFQTYIENTKTIQEVGKDMPDAIERMHVEQKDGQLNNCTWYPSHIFA